MRMLNLWGIRGRMNPTPGVALGPKCGGHGAESRGLSGAENASGITAMFRFVEWNPF